jgi:PAS domain-containing protein
MCGIPLDVRFWHKADISALEELCPATFSVLIGPATIDFSLSRADRCLALKLNPGSAMSDTANAGTPLYHLSPQRDGLCLILETALDAVVIMKSNGIVADWNDRAVNIFGWSREEAVGRVMAPS